MASVGNGQACGKQILCAWLLLCKLISVPVTVISGAG